jgi:hypothetical protein
MCGGLIDEECGQGGARVVGETRCDCVAQSDAVDGGWASGDGYCGANGVTKAVVSESGAYR